ncbi:hypothetical protein [Chryseolinea lacunae]|uniref:Uncharacterized protein n=1 Tax=Chryseolinea lacunae TaxID=2801331 RepID=A0ABS1KWS5_9BACT|nr:hypothetical protein [Chryseolinea lacunae]MBL0743753.1 hypothetical protein [Chryseolinea lacunae]
MARPIKETPILKGKDARVFIEKTNNVVRVSDEKRAKVLENFAKLQAIAKF